MSDIVKNRSPEMVQALISFEERQLHRNFKFGVLYCKPGQKTEDEMYANGTYISISLTGLISTITVIIILWPSFPPVDGHRWGMAVHGSPAFEEFLEMLGTKIDLSRWQGFLGGLNTKGASLPWLDARS